MYAVPGTVSTVHFLHINTIFLPYNWGKLMGGKTHSQHIHQIHNAENIHFGGSVMYISFIRIKNASVELSADIISYPYIEHTHSRTHRMFFLKHFPEPNPPILSHIQRFFFPVILVVVVIRSLYSFRWTSFRTKSVLHHITQSTSTATQRRREKKNFFFLFI